MYELYILPNTQPFRICFHSQGVAYMLFGMFIRGVGFPALTNFFAVFIFESRMSSNCEVAVYNVRFFCVSLFGGAINDVMCQFAGSFCVVHERWLNQYAAL